MGRPDEREDAAPRRHDGGHRALEEPIRARRRQTRVGRGRGSALTGPFPGAREDLPEDHEYLKAHAELLQRDAWIIDGFGCVKSAWERFASADTLVYIDLPLFTHFLWMTKRLLKGPFVTPEGWPEGSPILSSTINSYRVLWLCHRRLIPKYRELVGAARQHKRVHHLRSAAEMDAFLNGVRREAQRA